MSACGAVYHAIYTCKWIESVDEMCDHSDETYCSGQYFPVVLFKMVLTFEYVDESVTRRFG